MELNESMPIYPARFFPISHIHVPNPDFSANTSSLGNEASFDEAGEQDMNYERKLKRMISNRESARRSRLRKTKQIEELQYQVDQLHCTNRQLSEKLIQLLEGNQQILQENAQLKERVSSLQIILADLITPLGIAGHVTVNTMAISLEPKIQARHDCIPTVENSALFHPVQGFSSIDA